MRKTKNKKQNQKKISKEQQSADFLKEVKSLLQDYQNSGDPIVDEALDSLKEVADKLENNENKGSKRSWKDWLSYMTYAKEAAEICKIIYEILSS